MSEQCIDGVEPGSVMSEVEIIRAPAEQPRVEFDFEQARRDPSAARHARRRSGLRIVLACGESQRAQRKNGSPQKSQRPASATSPI